MLYFDRIGVSEGIDVRQVHQKTSASKECITCHYCSFLAKVFKFQLDV